VGKKMKALVKHAFAWYKEGDIIEITDREEWLVYIGTIEKIEEKKEGS